MESKEYNWVDGLKQMPELAKGENTKSANHFVFTVKDEAFLECIFNSGITDVLKKNHDFYVSKKDKKGSKYIPACISELLNDIFLHPHQVSIIYEDETLIEEYRTELEGLKQSIPNIKLWNTKTPIYANTFFYESGRHNKYNLLIGNFEEDRVTIQKGAESSMIDKYLKVQDIYE
ncbi:MAG: hypothetical protein KAI18_02220 [Candidatus Aenigmarchaeota archaeon]|nr:hypothetical protein [Candidatus Aenigmarchaeota archaeon]